MRDLSEKRTRFAGALNECRAVLSRGPKDYAKWQRNARETVQKLYDLKKSVHIGGVDLGLSLPISIESGLIGFINDDLRRAYLWNDVTSITDLPAPISWLEKIKQFVEDLGGKKKIIRRRRGVTQKLRPLTARQAEVIQIVGECKGNIAKAAEKLGRNRKTIDEAYRAGMAKLGKQVIRSKDKTRLFARDRRGQYDVSSDDDQRF